MILTTSFTLTRHLELLILRGTLNYSFFTELLNDCFEMCAAVDEEIELKLSNVFHIRFALTTFQLNIYSLNFTPPLAPPLAL